MEWNDVNDCLPLPEGLVSEKDALVLCDDGSIFAGYYHCNGCFYAHGAKGMAVTAVAEKRYGSHVAGIPKATYWIFTRDIPRPKEG